MEVAAYPRLVQIYLNIPSVRNLIVVVVRQADPNQTIARHDLTTCGRGIGFDRLSDDALAGVSPSNSIPGRRFMAQALGKVEYASRYQQSCTGEHQPCSCCKN